MYLDKICISILRKECYLEIGVSNFEYLNKVNFEEKKFFIFL